MHHTVPDLNARRTIYIDGKCHMYMAAETHVCRHWAAATSCVQSMGFSRVGIGVFVVAASGFLSVGIGVFVVEALGFLSVGIGVFVVAALVFLGVGIGVFVVAALVFLWSQHWGSGCRHWCF
jgi:hypothetical protein